MLTVLITSVEPGPRWICNIYFGVWFKISLHLKALLEPHLYERDLEKIVSAIFDEIVEALRRGDRVELRGFVGCLPFVC
jgi:hypothetical protein